MIREKVTKVPNQMEAVRVFNYPYQAIEEAVVNAFYHRDYMSCEPVTIEIEPDLSEGHSSGIPTIQDELEIPALTALLPELKDERILDLGCGCFNKIRELKEQY